MKRALLALALLAPLFGAVSARAQDGPLKRTGEQPAAKEIAAPEAKKPPADGLQEGGPTVVCDGKKPGGYRVEMNGKDGLIFAACLKKHEQSHIADYEKTCPGGCKGRANGDLAPMDGPRCAAFEKAEDWNSWRAQSECKAYGVERLCLKELYAGESNASAQRQIRIKVRDVRCRLTRFKCPGQQEPWDWFIENCK